MVCDLCTCLHHMVILRTRNKITDFLMILAWASPFNYIDREIISFVTLALKSGAHLQAFSRRRLADNTPNKLPILQTGLYH